MERRDEKAFEEMIALRKPVACEKCKSKMKYIGDGKYQCSVCEWEATDDFGKLKQFFDIHGSAPMNVVQKETGLRLEMIEGFIKKGKIQIPEDAEYYLWCERCGCGIRYGRYCQDCTQKIAKRIEKALQEDHEKI